MSQSIRVRPARDTDERAITSIWTECYVTPGTGGRTEPYTAADYRYSATHGEVLVAERDGSLAGVIVLLPPGTPARIAEGGEAEISRLGVPPAARRGGVARTLMETCHARARELGCPSIVLWSRPEQREAHALYESLGYRRAAERDTADEHGPCLVYRLEIASR